jgi:hypothetical protein
MAVSALIGRGLVFAAGRRRARGTDASVFLGRETASVVIVAIACHLEFDALARSLGIAGVLAGLALVGVKNTERTIYITTRRGFELRYRRSKKGGTQTGPNGVVRPMTAEQLLSHVPPALPSGHLTVRMEPDAVEEEA